MNVRPSENLKGLSKSDTNIQPAHSGAKHLKMESKQVYSGLFSPGGKVKVFRFIKSQFVEKIQAREKLLGGRLNTTCLISTTLHANCSQRLF